MTAKKEFSAVVVKVSRNVFQMFSVPDGESGQSCGVLEPTMTIAQGDHVYEWVKLPDHWDRTEPED